MRTTALLLSVALAGCATVRQADVDAWKGVPVEALDTHSLFLTMPMVRTVSSSGIEIRNYANGMDVSSCTGGTIGSARSSRPVSSAVFATCSSSRVTCNNLFYIRDGKVLEYAPTGSCYTDDSARPQKRWLELRQQS